VQQVSSAAQTISAGFSEGASVKCPAGTIVTGGGFSWEQGPLTGWGVTSSQPIANGWAINIVNENSQDISVVVFAECFSLS
jgi:hypothetical protein